MEKKVLLTGISGFLGSHTAIQLLEKGYHVTGTLRDLQRAPSIKKVIAKYTKHTDRLLLVQADLSDRAVWMELTKGMDFVQHIASPFPRKLPKHEDELIIPAREGVLNILRASARNQVQRVVITSSSSTVLYGKQPGQETGTYDETVWTDLTNTADTTPYYRSKTIAEKAAWDFVAADPNAPEMVTVLPGAILGPVLEDDFGTSANIVLKMLDGSMPALPDIGFDIVDVRSVADMLIRAMEIPAAAGERFLSSAGFVSFSEISEILRSAYPARKIPRRRLPDFLARLLAIFDKTLAPVLLDLGKVRKVSNRKAKDLLQWQPIDPREAVLSCARSLITLGLVK